ncbi:MAG: c-type cytochrome biogenesis protein CcmI [Pseudomonadota bacterium]
MIFWVLIAAVTAGATALLIRQLGVSTSVGPSARQGDVAIYAAQLRELETDLASGRVSSEDAAPLRTEIARRLLRAERLAASGDGTSGDLENAEVSQTAGGPPPILTGLLIASTAGASLLVYIAIGAPNANEELERSAAIRGQIAAQNAQEQAAAQANSVAPGRDANAQGASNSLSGSSIGQLVAQVEARLAAVPDDGQGWAVIAPIYVRMNRYADAANAYERAIELVGDTADRRVGRGEALVLVAQGQVTPEARAQFDRAVTLDPRHTMAHAWLAESAAQAGDLTAATATLRDLLARPETAPNLRPLLFARLAAYERGPDEDGRFRNAPASDAGRAIASALPADQRQQIAAMVEGLEERLFSDGGTAREWIRLIRARVVLGERERARRALRIAQQTLSGPELRAPAFAQFVQLLSQPEPSDAQSGPAGDQSAAPTGSARRDAAGTAAQQAQ